MVVELYSGGTGYSTINFWFIPTKFNLAVAVPKADALCPWVYWY
jgi:hypothetical protein